MSETCAYIFNNLIFVRMIEEMDHYCWVLIMHDNNFIWLL